MVQLGWFHLPSFVSSAGGTHAHTHTPALSVSPWRRRHPVPGTDPPLTTWECTGYGSHAYMVTPRGARRLLAHALPMEMHVDAYLGIMASLGLVRGYAWPKNLASQCRSWVQHSIPHVTFDAWTVNWKLLTPDLPLGSFLLLVTLALVLLVVQHRVSAS